MRAVSKKRAVLNRQRKQLRDALVAEQAPCEAHLEGCGRVGTDLHELLTRARGGSIVDRDNTAWLCRPCHRKITENPAWADHHGWTISSWDTDTLRAWAIRYSVRCDLSCELDHRLVMAQ